MPNKSTTTRKKVRAARPKYKSKKQTPAASKRTRKPLESQQTPKTNYASVPMGTQTHRTSRTEQNDNIHSRIPPNFRAVESTQRNMLPTATVIVHSRWEKQEVAESLNAAGEMFKVRYTNSICADAIVPAAGLGLIFLDLTRATYKFSVDNVLETCDKVFKALRRCTVIVKLPIVTSNSNNTLLQLEQEQPSAPSSDWQVLQRLLPIKVQVAPIESWGEMTQLFAVFLSVLTPERIKAAKDCLQHEMKKPIETLALATQFLCKLLQSEGLDVTTARAVLYAAGGSLARLLSLDRSQLLEYTPLSTAQVESLLRYSSGDVCQR